jgi:lysophospholipid acyltransferase (LPLAT)-like uncharacterized protein
LLKIKIISWLGSLFLRAVGATSRIIWVNRSVRDDLESEGKGFIYAFWHGRQAFLAYLHRGDAIRPLISQSADGEIIAQVCHRLGLKAIRGSSSRGASEAIMRLQVEIQSGARVGITPDGPRGPLHSVQRGALYLAQLTGAPIVPVAYGAKRKWTVKSWDEFIVPKPFNKIAMIYGEPIYVREGDDLDRKADELKQALDYVTHEVDIISQGACHEQPVGLSAL